MYVLNDILVIALMVLLCIASYHINIFLIKERELIKTYYQSFPIMEFIKAKDLMPGDIFKVNPRLPKEHWVDTVHEKFNHVQIVTWGRTTLSMKADDLVFLIRSTNPDRNGKK
jgi:hypothetical protein